MSDEEKKLHGKRLAAKVVSTASSVAAAVVPSLGGYALKPRPMFDLYQGELEGIDYDGIAALNPLCVFLQASCGPYGRRGDPEHPEIDRAVVEFSKNFKSLGVRISLIHLMLPGDVPQQCDLFSKAVDACGTFGAAPSLDVEVDNFTGHSQGTAWANDNYQWLTTIEKRCGVKPTIYTSRVYWAFLRGWKQISVPRKQMVLVAPWWTGLYWGWFAGYPFVPWLDSNVDIPRGYIAEGFSLIAGWQYFDRARNMPPRGYATFPTSDLSMGTAAFEEYLKSRSS